MHIWRIRKGPDRRSTGRQAELLAPSHDRLAGRSPPSRGSCDELPWPALLLADFTLPEPVCCAGSVKAVVEKDQPLDAFVRDRLAEGWSLEQIAGWLNGGRAAVCTVGCDAIDAFICRATQKAGELWRGLSRRHRCGCAGRARPSRDKIWNLALLSAASLIFVIWCIEFQTVRRESTPLRQAAKAFRRTSSGVRDFADIIAATSSGRIAPANSAMPASDNGVSSQ